MRSLDLATDGEGWLTVGSLQQVSTGGSICIANYFEFRPNPNAVVAHLVGRTEYIYSVGLVWCRYYVLPFVNPCVPILYRISTILYATAYLTYLVHPRTAGEFGFTSPIQVHDNVMCML